MISQANVPITDLLNVEIDPLLLLDSIDDPYAAFWLISRLNRSPDASRADVARGRKRYRMLRLALAWIWELRRLPFLYRRVENATSRRDGYRVGNRSNQAIKTHATEPVKRATFQGY